MLPVHQQVASGPAWFNFGSIAESGPWGAVPPSLPPLGSMVPEPNSWALLIVGFGLVGVAGRRKGVMA
jgi:hypothetical protein